MDANEFGGEWTLQKLGVVQDYLREYLKIFHGNVSARHLRPTFVDGFAGCGTRTPRATTQETLSLFGSDEDRAEAEDLARSSPRIALELEKDFSHYLFIDSNPRHVEQLQALVEEDFPHRRTLCQFEVVDANDFLPRWCESLGRSDRAVMFLDPFGTEVQWTTIQAIAETEKVDLWLLFPCSGVLRMLPRNERPPEAWATRLTQLFGTGTWQTEWYQTLPQGDLFGAGEAEFRDLDATSLARWVTRRLGTVFTQTVETPLFLLNRKNSPLFMLTFAAGNPAGAPVACRIADYIIRKQLKAL